MGETPNSPPGGRSGEKIVVTGANGQLGMEIRELSSLYPEYDFIFLSRQDLAIENAPEVASFFIENLPQFCINCAAYTAVDKAESEKEEAFRINTEAVGVLAAACKEQNTILIHISTDYVYNGEATVPYKEDSPVDPLNIYGASKLVGEKLALKNNQETIIIRTSWVYSAYGKNFVKTMLRLMKEKREISVVNDQFGAPTYAADLAEGILKIISTLTTQDLLAGGQGSELKAQSSKLAAYSGIYHYTNEGAITWYEFALAIKEFSASQCIIHPITSRDYPTPAKRPSYAVLDTTSIKQVFPVVIKNWKQSLKTCIEKIQANN